MFDTRTKTENKNRFKSGVANKLACYNLMDVVRRYRGQKYTQCT